MALLRKAFVADGAAEGLAESGCQFCPKRLEHVTALVNREMALLREGLHRRRLQSIEALIAASLSVSLVGGGAYILG